MTKVLVVAGSREGVSAAKVAAEIRDWMETHGRPDEIVHGACRGVDQHAAAFAAALGIPVRAFPADWRKDGKGAGPRRNARMAQYATHALVIHTGSRGSRDMVRAAARARIHVDEREVIADESVWVAS